MQRSIYPAKTPPLHHPVPQKPVTVPVMHSPPPPPSSSNSYYPSPYDEPSYSNGGSGGLLHPSSAFTAYGAGPGGFMADPTTQMGLSVAKAAMSGGTEYAEKNINRYLATLRPYFAVTNTYVLQKLRLLLFPYRHTPWFRVSSTRSSSTPGGPLEYYYLPPREDINSPDLYIPVMSIVTYILLNSFISGISGNFHPKQLAQTASTSFVIMVFEIAIMKLGSYLLNISNGNGEGQLLDLLGYSGYKFFGAIMTILIGEVLGQNGVIGWSVFLYFFAGNAFFLLRSLKYVLLPSENNPQEGRGVYISSSTVPRTQRKRRTWFLFFYSYVVQLLSALILTSGVGKGK